MRRFFVYSFIGYLYYISLSAYNTGEIYKRFPKIKCSALFGVCLNIIFGYRKNIRGNFLKINSMIFENKIPAQKSAVHINGSAAPFLWTAL